MSDKFVLVTDGHDDDGAKRRMQILLRNRELMEHHFSLSADKDVAFLIMELSPKFDLPDDLKAFVIKSIEEEVIPTGIVMMRRWALYKELRKLQRELHKMDARNLKVSRIIEQLAQPAADHHFWALVWAQRGKQAIQYRLPT